MSLVIGEIFDGLLESFNFDGAGVASGPVIGSFLAAFGFGAALTMYSAGTGAGVSALAGLGAGLAVGAAALAITHNLMNMPTDAPMRSADLVGSVGTVVTPIPEDGIGEISLVHRGQPMKLTARSSQPIVAGIAVTVVTVVSPSSVVVKPNT